ncbi:hypothetical protein BS47DRAFT_1392272 [Hydnum rufescens UP504]|uniref:Uncharacterized protein n=1 Tax=Hydnum rufescens UP504 TaxID=1448309 RepID=A0A9P6B1L4_9AGAM|nr:hypothetical protein BS47DRAFT_1392272 [Hydnum rufescens UP504]
MAGNSRQAPTMAPVRLWDAMLGAPLATLEGWIMSGVFSVESLLRVSGPKDQSNDLRFMSGSKIVRLWDVLFAVHIATLPGHPDFVFSIEFPSDGSPWLRFNYPSAGIGSKCFSKSVHAVVIGDGKAVWPRTWIGTSDLNRDQLRSNFGSRRTPTSSASPSPSSAPSAQY